MDSRALVCAVRPSLRRKVEAWFRGREVRHASTPEEALLWAAESAPPLVVWDLDSEAYGRAALEALRRIRPMEPVLGLEPGRGPARAVFLGGLCVLSGRLDGAAVRAAACELERLARDRDELQPDAEVLRVELRRLAWLSRSLDALPVAVTLVDENGQVLEANAEARRLARRRPAGPCSRFWRCGVEPERCPLRKALRTGKPVKRNLLEREPGVGERFLIERVSPLVDPVGGGRAAALVTGPATGYVKRQRRLLEQARVDPLTRLLNRRRFDELCRLSAHDRRAGPSAFLMIDVDGLKAVNDRFGHAAGDRLLSRLAEVLSSRTRQGDLVARLGGDEFAVRCPHTTHAQAEELVRRLRRAVKADNQRHAAEPPLAVSIGLACADGPGEALRSLADRRLRAVKRRRGGRGPELAQPGAGDALLVAGMQEDAMRGVPGAGELVAPINALTRSFASRGLPVLFLVQGRRAELAGGLRRPEGAEEVRGQAAGRSAFDGTDLAERLRGRGVRRLWLVGAAAERCVRATALDARREGLAAVVVGPLVRASSRAAGLRALAQLEGVGVAVRGTA